MSLEKMVELAKSMEEMNLQETEISRLKKEIENLQELKYSYQTSLLQGKTGVRPAQTMSYNSSGSKQWQVRHWPKSKKVSGQTSPSL
jgi:hypothetical protein